MTSRHKVVLFCFNDDDTKPSGAMTYDTKTAEALTEQTGRLYAKDVLLFSDLVQAVKRSKATGGAHG